MCQYDEVKGPATLELNASLYQAHLELLSAHCATHKLRLRYSSDDLLRFGHREVVRKSAKAASDLNDFYAALEQKITTASRVVTSAAPPTREQIAEAVGWLSSYLGEQREHYWPVAAPIPVEWKTPVLPYFSSTLLDEVRLVELRGARVPVPDFFVQARLLGYEPPEIAHMESLTFVDVIAFNQEFSPRALFHALVHSVQIRMLGLERYAELWIRSFIQTRAHFGVPLEVHAFSLASKFLAPGERFRVEDEVFRWIADGRY
jgi:hypothetical protein